MPESGVVSAYLDELNRALRLPRRYRSRVVAEAQEHLADAARQELDHGSAPEQAELRALSRFGPVPVVSAAFHRQWASRAVRTALLAVLASAAPAIVAQALGSPLFWHVSGGLRVAGPWPVGVKDGAILAADLRSMADVVALVAMATGLAGLVRTRRSGAGPAWRSGLAGLVAAAALEVSALCAGAELAIATGVGPSGIRLAIAAGLLGATVIGAGGTVAWVGWRLWRARSGWMPAGGLVDQVQSGWAGISSRARGALRRGVLIAVPGAVLVTVAAGLVEFVGQGNLRSGANNPQQAMAAAAARQLAEGVAPATVAAGAKVDLARDLGVHITVFDSAGRVLASTAVLDGRTPAPPAGVLRTAGRRTDVVTWQPQPAVRVAAVATAWSGPNGRGALVVGRSLRIVEQRESRLLRRIAWGWLSALAVVALIALLSAWRRPPPGVRRRAWHRSAGVAAA